jgi:predicted DNA-binding ribbon-helix-helix protein
MESRAIKRSLRLGGRDISFSIEPHFWICLEEIARLRATTAARLAASIAATQTDGNLAATIRSFVLEHYQRQVRNLENTDPAPRHATMAASDIDIGNPRPRWLN